MTDEIRSFVAEVKAHCATQRELDHALEQLADIKALVDEWQPVYDDGYRGVSAACVFAIRSVLEDQ